MDRLLDLLPVGLPSASYDDCDAGGVSADVSSVVSGMSVEVSEGYIPANAGSSDA